MSAVMLSTKGQVVIPKHLRDARNWHAGMALEVQELPQGLLLRPAKAALFPSSSIEDVMGSANYAGSRLSDDDIAAAVSRMHAAAEAATQ